MSATIEQFPTPWRTPLRGADVAQRYVRRAEEAFELLARSTTDLERTTLCDIAEIWLDMAEAALPARALSRGAAPPAI
jgi:hypothetical protein